MKAISKEEMKIIDNNKSLILGSYQLMELAGTKMAKIILKDYEFENALIIIGSGGNAGDGLVVARILNENNKKVYVYKTKEIKNIDAIKNESLYSSNYVSNLDDLDKYDIIIDALYGIGLNKELNESDLDIINIINNSNKLIISLDIPSGIDSNNGVSYGSYVKSDLCISVEYHKIGLFLNDGIDSYKKLKLVKLNMDKPNNLISIVNKKGFNEIFKERRRNTNKSSYKRSSIIAGSIKYPGASLLSYQSLNAFQMGLGYSYLYVIESLYNSYSLIHPEIITNKLSEIDGHIKYNEEELDNIIKNSDSIAIGMGMDISIDLYNSIRYLLLNYKKNLIIDADGINTISKYGIDILKNKKCNLVLTPHLKEFSRLINKDMNEIKNNPLNLAKEFAKEYDLILILKSQTSIITDGNNVEINITGNSALAKAGSGDSLTGILSGIMAYDYNQFIKAKIATYMFGLMAEEASKQYPEEVLTISMINKFLPKVFKKLKK